jgi:7-cyano-7-deazaguanine synthase in queuosine biosynthesis
MNTAVGGQIIQLLIKEEQPMPTEKIGLVREILKSLGDVAVAYSGGIDSTLLAYLAASQPGSRSVAVTAVSPSLAKRARRRSLSQQIGIRHVLLESHEVRIIAIENTTCAATGVSTPSTTPSSNMPKRTGCRGWSMGRIMTIGVTFARAVKPRKNSVFAPPCLKPE